MGHEFEIYDCFDFIKSIFQVVRSSDIYASSPHLYFKSGHSKNKTCRGGCLTLLTLVAFVYLFYLEISRVQNQVLVQEYTRDVVENEGMVKL